MLWIGPWGTGNAPRARIPRGIPLLGVSIPLNQSRVTYRWLHLEVKQRLICKCGPAHIADWAGGSRASKTRRRPAPPSDIGYSSCCMRKRRISERKVETEGMSRQSDGPARWGLGEFRQVWSGRLKLPEALLLRLASRPDARPDHLGRAAGDLPAKM